MNYERSLEKLTSNNNTGRGRGRGKEKGACDGLIKAPLSAAHPAWLAGYLQFTNNRIAAAWGSSSEAKASFEILHESSSKLSHKLVVSNRVAVVLYFGGVKTIFFFFGQFLCSKRELRLVELIMRED